MNKSLPPVLTPIVAALAVALPSAADVVEFADPATLTFSGNEVQLGLEGLAPIPGFPVAQAGAVAVGLEDAAGTSLGDARFGQALEPREFGPSGSGSEGSLNNFEGGGLPFPFPAIRMTFPEKVNRVALAIRANEMDDVQVSFRSGGAQMDQKVRRSPTTATFHFYGFESASGFDEMVVSAGASFTALALDNLTYEVVPGMAGDPGSGDPGSGDPGSGDPGAGDPPADPEPPVADVPSFSCDGFHAPTDWMSEDMRKSRFGRLAQILARRLPFRLFSARLEDHHGVPVAEQDLHAAPVLQVLHTPPGSDETHDITERSVRRDSDFAYRGGHAHWLKAVKRSALEKPGTYVLTMESGDASEYALEPACVEWIVREPPKEEERPRWMRRWKKVFGDDGDRRRRRGRDHRDDDD